MKTGQLWRWCVFVLGVLLAACEVGPATDDGAQQPTDGGTTVVIVRPTPTEPTECEAHTEICNTLDDDCDGAIDENLIRGCSNICADGVQTCTHGAWSECSARLPSAETCNHFDDDCDNATDEDLTRACASECGTGVEHCRDGVFVGCTAPAPQSETCNHLDDDCDGVIDNVPATLVGSVTHCGECFNDCRDDFRPHGVPVCAAGVCEETDCDANWHNVTFDLPGPGSFTTTGCPYSCAQTVAEESDNGILCSDGLDNDCDGVKDEGCTCRLGTTRECGVAIGECGQGIQRCTIGDNGEVVWGGACEGQVVPQTEVCDNTDNDCDGFTDERNPANAGELVSNCNLPHVATHECFDGTCEITTCVANWYNRNGARRDGCEENCVVSNNGTEICDSQDNDCNGVVDDVANVTCACTSANPFRFFGPQNPDGSFLEVGICERGTQECVAGVWTTPIAAVFPAADDTLCNSFDDDCDGTTDEDVDLSSDVNHCGTCMTVCSFEHASALCVLGVCERAQCEENWWNLDGEPTSDCPYACVMRSDLETCNGVDDNCDGATDEGNPGGGANCVTGLPGQCNQGTTTCDNGMIMCNSIVSLDDPSCACNDGDEVSCGAVDDQGAILTAGECEAGTRSCAGGSFGSCQDFQGPVPETCNGLDGDCSGDDAAVTEADADQDGWRVCDNDCNEADSDINPAATDMCDTMDNNCDGETDEGLFAGQAVSTSCDGVGECGSGVRECDPNDPARTICSTDPGGSEIQAQPDITCDGLDNNCDGEIDEGLGCQCVNGATRPCGTDEGECVAGIETCVDGQFNGSTCTATPPASELCDMQDNDCDNSVDEDNPGGGGNCTVNGVSGVCAAGVLVCSGGTLVCTQTVQLSPEACDGEDDDCDGATDEELLQACSSICGAGVEQCVSGSFDPTTCTAPQPQVETCNSLDDDCDGETDDGSALCAAGLMCLAGSCEPDTDGDTVPDQTDNCFQTANTDQANADADNLGDVCDLAGVVVDANECTGGNLLSNPSFEINPASLGWALEFTPVSAQDPAESASLVSDATRFVDGAASARVTNATAYPADEAWRVQLKQSLVLTVGRRYELCGYTAADAAREIVVQVVDDQTSASGGLDWKQFGVGTSFTPFPGGCFRFTAAAVASSSSHRVTFMAGGSSVAVNVDRVTLRACPQ